MIRNQELHRAAMLKPPTTSSTECRGETCRRIRGTWRIPVFQDPAKENGMTRTMKCRYIINLTESSERVRIELQTYDRWHKATTFDVFKPTSGITNDNRDDFVIGSSRTGSRCIWASYRSWGRIIFSWLFYLVLIHGFTYISVIGLRKDVECHINIG